MTAGTFLQAAVEGGNISERAATIVTFALCGFANFGSMGIMVGGTPRG